MFNNKALRNILMPFVIALVAMTIYYAIWIMIDGGMYFFWPFSWNEVLIDYLTCFIVTIAVTIYYWRSYMSIQHERDTFKMKALENQINPHFVFNNFSVLSELIEKDSGLAQEFLMNLSRIYRYNLNNTQKTLVSVNEELKFLDMYINIMKTRLGNCFFVTMDYNVSTLQGSIPPCSLQMLVENALKHNAHTIENPLLISITADENYISISNKKQALDVQTVSTNVGNNNLRERYSLLSKNNIVIKNSEDYYTVLLPII